jgi:2-polyprenyl-6-methoxyphenol hydroxylase-like FAD-dependent oxidoreductase
MRVAINGMGVAGPVLAYWLRRAGHDVLLIEQAPALREGGYIIDFWGIGYDIAEKMGLVPRIRELGYQVREVRFVDARGRTRGGFPVEIFTRLTRDRFTSLRRSDLSATIVAALDSGVERRFGDSIASLEPATHGVRVAFDRGDAREVDLVVGADGLHSRVRQLVFGDESKLDVSLGYHVAAFETGGYRPRDELVYVSHGVPGRQVSRFAMRDDRTMFLFIFRDEYLSPDRDADGRAHARHAFSNVGWECPQILDAMTSAPDLYFDRVSQIRMDRWTAGRTALIGDAAACVSLMAGEGTGLAICEAYVLAGELQAASGDLPVAFERYERCLRTLLARKQRTAARLASSFAPATNLGIATRDIVTRLLRVPWVADYFIGRDLRDDITLPDYVW